MVLFYPEDKRTLVWRGLIEPDMDMVPTSSECGEVHFAKALRNDAHCERAHRWGTGPRNASRWTDSTISGNHEENILVNWLWIMEF